MIFPDYISFYKNHTSFAPYDYQIKVAEILLAGKNVILSVPTGAGKTWASIMPFIFSKKKGLVNFPEKMIYSLPLRTLANSIHTDVTNVLRNKSFENISIQTGEYNDDKYFEKQIVFSTIDQTLSNFLCFPLPLSQRQANINAGSLIGSYLVFDEFHLLDPKLSMATSLGMLQILKNLCRVCIMTATLTDDYIQFIKEKFDFEVVSLKDFPNDIEKIKSLKPAKDKSVKKNITVFSDKTINVKDIISRHKNRTIVICNRVEKAQQIYNDLVASLEKDNDLLSNDNIICLHSRFFDKDRKAKELKLKQLFGKDSNESAILISTQVIEAGMDISCETMHTEISPINSFLQRAGRCARFENEYGEVFVYDILDLDEKEKILEGTNDEADIEEIRKLNNKYLPYDKKLCSDSLVELSKHEFIDEKVASKLVNAVLGKEEKQIIDTITQRIYNKNKIKESWKDCDKKHYRETIRDIQNVDIVLIDMKNLQGKKIITWQYETISVYKWSFINWAKQVSANKMDEDDWIFGKAELSSDSCFDFEWQDKDTRLLRQLQSDDIKNYYDVIFVDNRYFDYTKAGLLVSKNNHNEISPIKQCDKEEKQINTYKKDTFYQHNKGLINCFETEFKPYLKFTFQELNSYWGEKIDWEYLIKVALCFHDYGKLNHKWQEIVKGFQEKKSGINNPNEILAHTDYDETTDKELAKECGMKNKPPHAGIGACQVYQMLYDAFSEEIAIVVTNAVLKHHAPDTNSADNFNICKAGICEMEKLMKEYGIDGKLAHKLTKENDLGIMPSQDREWLLYMLLVRILRLCDQKATESLEKYYIS